MKCPRFYLLIALITSLGSGSHVAGDPPPGSEDCDCCDVWSIQCCDVLFLHMNCMGEYCGLGLGKYSTNDVVNILIDVPSMGYTAVNMGVMAPGFCIGYFPFCDDGECKEAKEKGRRPCGNHITPTGAYDC